VTVPSWVPGQEASQPLVQVGPGGEVSLGAEPGGPPDIGLLTLLLTMLLTIRDTQHDGTWPRLKACGNRIKNRRLRQRQR
jgi:hypothetical protein